MPDSFLKHPLSHAYLFGNESKDELLNFLSKSAEKEEVVIIETVQLGVSESRALFEAAQTRSLKGQKYIFVSADEITIEAQHSLLKLLEEPPEGVHFFILTGRPHSLLSTLRSRCVLVSQKAAEKQTTSKFLTLSLKDKFTHITSLVDSHKDDEEGITLKQEAEKLFDEVLFALHKEKGSKTHLQKANEILNLKSHLFSRGASVKQLLETMAIIIS